MHEGQEDGLQREVVPETVEGRRPDQHAALAHRTVQQGGFAAVETGHHRRALGRLQTPEPLEARTGEIPAARAGEEFEHGVVVVEPRQPAAIGRIHEGTGAGAEQFESGVGPPIHARIPPEDDEQAPAVAHPLAQPAGPARVGEVRVVEDREVRRRQRGGIETRRRRPRSPDAGRVADFEGALEKETPVRRPAVVLQDERAQPGLGRRHEAELVVDGQPVPRDREAPAAPSFREGQVVEHRRPGSARRHVHRDRRHRPPGDLERHREPVHRRIAHVREPGHEPDAPVVRGPHRRLRERHVRGLLRRDARRPQRHPIGKPHPAAVLPPRALEVRDERHLPPPVFGLREDPPRKLDPRFEPRPQVGRRQVREGVPGGDEVERQRHPLPRPLIERRHRDAVPFPETVEYGARGVEGRLPAPFVAQARRHIEEDDDVTRRTRLDRRRRVEKGPGEGEREEDDRQAAQGEEQGMPDPPPVHRLEGQLPEEHQRREYGHPAALAMREVDDDRDREEPEPGQEPRGQETHRSLPFRRRDRCDR